MGLGSGVGVTHPHEVEAVADGALLDDDLVGEEDLAAHAHDDDGDAPPVGKLQPPMGKGHAAQREEECGWFQQPWGRGGTRLRGEGGARGSERREV